MSWLERYTNGDCEGVWEELYALGSTVRRLDCADDAMAVARETMRRVRANCELLVARLESLGWRFGYEWAEDLDDPRIAQTPQVIGDPTPPPVLDELELRYGALPLAFRAFYEIVGEVNFVGTPVRRPDWPAVEDGLDPLYVAGASEIAQGTRGPGSGWVPVTPDFLVKYFVGGVGYVYVQLPERRADAALLFEGTPLYAGERRLTLVRYLRYALRGGGFGAFMPGSAWTQRPLDDLVFLTRDLLPI